MNCICGHERSEHGGGEHYRGDKDYPDSTACNVTMPTQYEGELWEECECTCFVEDIDAA